MWREIFRKSFQDEVKEEVTTRKSVFPYFASDRKSFTLAAFVDVFCMPWCCLDLPSGSTLLHGTKVRHSNMSHV